MAHWYVKELCKLTDVSVRTLHHYDQIDLLKPSIRQQNGYRLYSETDLLKLQHILALKSFGFSLTKIKVLMKSSDNALSHFKAQKQFLQEEVDNLQEAHHLLGRVIDKLENDNGSILIDDVVKLIKEFHMRDELYYDVDSEKQKKYETYLVENGYITQTEIEKGREKFKEWTKKDKDNFKKDIGARFQKLAEMVQRGIQPDAPEFQVLVRELYEWIKFCWTHKTPDKESFTGLGEMYCQHPEFRKFFDAHHPKLAEALAEGMKIFSERELK